MARVKPIEPQDAPPEVKEIYDTVFKGKPGSFHKLLAHRPGILKAFVPFFVSVGRGIERRLYELLYIRVSMINECEYCLQHHLSASKRAGLTPDDWKALRNPESATFSEAEKAALRFAEKLTREPKSVSDSDFEELKKFFNEGQIVDIDATIAVANLTNRMTAPLGSELEFAAEKVSSEAS